MQKERGYSSGYLNGNGGEFAGKLIRQREVVDSELKKLNDLVAWAGPDLAAVSESVATASKPSTHLATLAGGLEQIVGRCKLA